MPKQKQKLPECSDFKVITDYGNVEFILCYFHVHVCLTFLHEVFVLLLSTSPHEGKNVRVQVNGSSIPF